ncbi:hypothetical protein OR571_05555 [Psychrobacillus sp. NEAU-3TGS]|uniref:hypothetical protein n=1 Tax=Psychrobacillus sp. NEAU-3TGS TaxID=2995412 RepID=UPI0024984B6E|nr:hypothetical protein [Psychrobacillus sp. NEAU-3TGS]MDI2586612.1 hypothetical protein [Psychrobacillus sp. NEAU-3TGS]
MSNTDRLEAIRAYFAEEEKIKVEVPVKISKTIKGDVHHYFNGDRAGYKFRHGIAWVERNDLHKFRGLHFIIHEEECGESK